MMTYDSEFRILGSLEVLVRGRSISICGRRRQLILSTLLLAKGNTVPFHRLIEAVWDLEPPPSARKQICNAVSDLRHTLSLCGASVLREADSYRLDIGNATYDATQFSRHVETARAYAEEGRKDSAIAEFKVGLSRWRGPALAGITSLALEPELVSLNEERLSALEECIALELDQGWHAPLIRQLFGLVAEYPLRERFAELLMLSLCGVGEYARALTVYEKTRQTLEDELGVAPGPRLQELRRRVMTNALPVPAQREEQFSRFGAGNSNLPGNVRHFTGRALEMNWIVEAARNYRAGQPAASAVIAIDGMPGVGKTALAVAASRVLAPDYPDAQLYLDLQTHTPGKRPLDMDQALRRLQRAMRVSDVWAAGEDEERVEAEFGERCAAWQRLLADRRILIVFDDVASARQITSLLPSGSQCLAIVISRRRLIGLDYTHQLSLLELSLAEGCDLFRCVLGDERAVAEPEAVARVVEMCGRLPLGIRIAASRLRHRPTWTAGHLAERLAGGRGLLDELQHEERSVAKSFDLSYERLKPPLQRLLQTLGANHSREISVNGIPDPDDGHLLEELADAHFLEEVQPGQFRMNDLLRHYLTRLADTDLVLEGCLK
jgi:DNA-binding SARP family transcriptional activator